MTRAWISIAVALVLVAPVSAGVVFEIETQIHTADPPTFELSRIQVDPEAGSVRWDVDKPGEIHEGSIIYRAGEPQLTMIHHGAKTYNVLGTESIAALENQTQERHRRVEDAMRHLPAEELERIQGKLEQQKERRSTPSHAAEIRPTGETAEENGNRCARLDVLRGDIKTGELCTKGWSDIEPGAATKEILDQAASFLGRVAAARGLPPRGGRLANTLIEEMALAEGLPVVIRGLFGDQLLYESRLLSVKLQPLPASAFDPPAEYTKQDLLHN